MYWVIVSQTLIVSLHISTFQNVNRNIWLPLRIIFLHHLIHAYCCRFCRKFYDNSRCCPGMALEQTAMHHSSCAWFFSIAMSRNTFISSLLQSSLMIYIMALLLFINCKNFSINFCMKGLTTLPCYNTFQTAVLLNTKL